MPITQFENRNEAPLVLTVQPWGDKHEVPHLATAGIRYSLKDGAEDRCYSVVADGAVEFWCNADSCELDVVSPSVFDRLSWDICVNGGWCGDIMDGNPTTVEDLLPQTGEINARQFAELAMRADGWPEGEPLDDKHLRWLEAKFVEHLGATSVGAENLRRNVARPFGDATS
jgi:hypothetical protein